MLSLGNARKNFSKKFEKPLDKPRGLWYNTDTVKRETERWPPKKILKISKKTLDKTSNLWYNNNVIKRSHLLKSRKELIL
jgi:hypothetical protein